MASNARAVFSQQIDDDGETPMFVIEKNDSLRIRKGQYSIKMSYYNRKVYFHIQSKLLTLLNKPLFYMVIYPENVN